MESILYRRFTLIVVGVAIVGVLAVQSVQQDIRRSADGLGGTGLQIIDTSPGYAATSRCRQLHCIAGQLQSTSYS